MVLFRSLVIDRVIPASHEQTCFVRSNIRKRERTTNEI